MQNKVVPLSDMLNTNMNTEKAATILMVDDNLREVQHLFDVLCKAGYKVLVAESGESALEQISVRQPDLILLDVRMSGMSGFETCRQLKANPLTKNIIVILMTADTEPVDEVMGLQLGAADYISKPFQVETILARINMHLALKKMQQRLEEQNAQLQQEIEQRERTAQALEKQNRELAVLNFTSQAFSSSLNLDMVLDTVLEEVRTLFEVIGTSFWLNNPETGHLICRYAKGLGSDALEGWRLEPGQGLTGWAAKNGQNLIIPDIQIDERYIRDVDQKIGTSLRSMLSIPLRLKEEIIGVLNVMDTTVDRFSENDVRLLEPLTVSAAIAIENARLHTAVQTELTERIRVEEALRELNDRLEHRVDERTRALQVEISERKRTEIELIQSHRELMALNSIATIISQSRDLEFILVAVLGKVLDTIFIQNETGMQKIFVDSKVAGCIYLLDKDETSLSLAVQRGFSKELIEAMRIIKIGAGRQSNMPLWDTPVLSQEERNLLPGDLTDYLSTQHKFLEITSQAGWQLLVNIPLQFEDKVLGLLSIFIKSNAPGQKSPEKEHSVHPVGTIILRQMQLLRSVGRQLGVAIENDRLAKRAAQVMVAREVNQLRSELIDNVSHELRTPLGLIKAACTTLMSEDVEFDQATKKMLLNGIDEETDKLENLVNNLLNLSRIKQKGLTLDLAPVDIGQLANKVIKAMETRETNSRFECKFPPQPIIATVDYNRVEQVLRNLLSNAEKYSPQGGVITVSGKAQQDHLLISVSDQGIGIAPPDLQHIFQRFYRVENSRTMEVRGVGLGLAITREIVEAHNGKIWVESEPDVGSTFYFTLQKQV